MIIPQSELAAYVEVEKRSLDEKIPDKELLNKSDVAKILGVKSTRNLRSYGVPFNKNGKITKTHLAIFLVKNK